MIHHREISRQALHRVIVRKEISLAGNARLKIFGMLTCASGKRMKKDNRVFFRDLSEALSAGYRPCGHCMRKAYREFRKTAQEAG